MDIKISGKNISTGIAFQRHAQEALEEVVNKYFSNAIAAAVTLEKTLAGFTVKTKVNLTKRMDLEATGHDARDAHLALDAAIIHAEKRLRRHKRRLKNHRNNITELEAAEHSITASLAIYESAFQAVGVDEQKDVKHKTHGDDTRQDSETEPDSLPVIAQLSYEIELFTVEQAVMKLELSDEPCLLFRNASHLGLNLVYTRNDNTIAWVDPRGNRGET
ncbi:HPF/RaiA family ribosome-associated protein [Alphaproteobacteria bacterium]|nr:HPF/RaiA family ribosome-associated protein [Alphaproteobacteria bacterium]